MVHLFVRFIQSVRSHHFSGCTRLKEEHSIQQGQCPVCAMCLRVLYAVFFVLVYLQLQLFGVLLKVTVSN